MKKSTKSLQAVMPILMVLSLLLSGCTPEPGAAEPDLTPTDELHLYIQDRDPTMYAAISLFEDEYPDVEVITETLGYDEYQDRLAADLMAGNGPDVLYFSWSTFPDIYKTMDAGVFVDLQPILEQDEEFDRGEYVDAVLDAGIYKGRQYVLPTQYTTNVFVSEKRLLEEAGLSDLPEVKDYGQFWGKLAEALPKLSGNAVFDVMVGNMNVDTFFRYSGVSLIDWEERKVLPDEEAVKILSETYKKVVYDSPLFGEESKVYFGDTTVTEGARNGNFVLLNFTNVSMTGYFDMLTGLIKAVGEPVTFEAPTVTGKTVAESLNLLGINGNSKNQLNAWNFMKIYLSDEVQGATSLLMTRKSSQQKGLSQTRDTLGKWVEDQTGVKVEFTDQEIDEYLALVQSPEQCVLGEPYVWEIYKECMESYCKGTDSYENCLEQLRSRLTVYLSE